jgi:SulP family sulfate permease
MLDEGSRMDAIAKIVPALGWIRNYDREDLSKDLSAGLIVAVMLIPQGMAYALLAGLPPIYGLYASTVPAIVYALFGTSRHMPVGPPALMALLTFAGVSTLAEPGSGQYISLALLLALMAGALQLAIGLLKMGFITNFIPHPVLSGFIYASAIIIAISQTKYILGISVSGEHSTVSTTLEIGKQIEDTNLITLVLGASSILALVLFAKMMPHLPGPLIVASTSTLAVYLLGLEDRGVQVVGDVPRGLPGLSLPLLNLEAFRVLLPAALTVAFVGFIESISVAKAIAAKEKYKIDSNQELKALGFANISAAFFSGFPVAGSFSRTAVQYQSGAKTQLASITTAVMILVTLLFLTPLFYYLPNAALAAVILVAVYKLLDLKDAKRIFEIRRADGYALLLTFVLTLLIGVEEGIIIGALFALLAFIRRTAYPNIAELGYVEEKEAFLGVNSYPRAKTFPEVLIIRFDAALYYANVPFLEEWLIKAVADRPKLSWIIIDCRAVNTIDTTAIEGLEDLVSGYRSRGIEVLFSHVKRRVRERLQKAGWDKKFGENLCCYPTTRDVLRTMDLLEGRRPRREQTAESDVSSEGRS